MAAQADQPISVGNLDAMTDAMKAYVEQAIQDAFAASVSGNYFQGSGTQLNNVANSSINSMGIRVTASDGLTFSSATQSFVMPVDASVKVSGTYESEASTENVGSNDSVKHYIYLGIGSKSDSSTLIDSYSYMPSLPGWDVVKKRSFSKVVELSSGDVCYPVLHTVLRTGRACTCNFRLTSILVQIVDQTS